MNKTKVRKGCHEFGYAEGTAKGQDYYAISMITMDQRMAMVKVSLQVVVAFGSGFGTRPPHLDVSLYHPHLCPLRGRGPYNRNQNTSFKSGEISK